MVWGPAPEQQRQVRSHELQQAVADGPQIKGAVPGGLVYGAVPGSHKVWPELMRRYPRKEVQQHGSILGRTYRVGAGVLREGQAADRAVVVLTAGQSCHGVSKERQSKSCSKA